MTKEQILKVVKDETGVDLTDRDNVRSKHTPNLFARYAAIVLMHEEGHKPEDIASLFELHRTAIYYALISINSLLETNKQFKKMYLACIKRIAENESNNETNVYATAS